MKRITFDTPKVNHNDVTKKSFAAIIAEAVKAGLPCGDLTAPDNWRALTQQEQNVTLHTLLAPFGVRDVQCHTVGGEAVTHWTFFVAGGDEET